MKVINLADIIIIFMGFYFLISTAMMKVHGKVNRMLVGKKYDIEKARDLPGFISVIFLPNIIIGVITMAAGIVHYIAEDLLGNSDAGIVIYIIYLVLFMIYAVILVRAQNKYLSPF